MSIDTNLYLGPYSITKKKKTKEAVTVSGCAKCRKEITDDSDFCKKCGSRVSVFKEERTEEVDACQFSEDEELDLIPVIGMREFNETHDFWIPNVDFMKRDPNLHVDDNSEFKIDPENLNQEIKQYKKHFNKDIDTITEKFGPMETTWGLLVWYS